MYNPNKRQYIFKQSSGNVWSFFCNERACLYYSTLTRRNSWTEPILIQKDVSCSFFADMDYEDCFHILYQDNRGNIYYSRMDNGSFKTMPLLNSKQPSPYDKHFFMIPRKNAAHIFFTIHHNNHCLLAHQIITNTTFEKPKVIDYVMNNKLPYSITCDKSGNIYAFYQSSDGKFMQTGYKKYLQTKNFWGEFTPVTRFNGDTELVRAISDNKSIVHICYQRRVGGQYELVYQQKASDKNIWASEAVIYTSVNSFTHSSILCVNNSIIIFWVRNDIVYYSSSNDNGSTWNKPGKYNFHVGRQLLCIRYKTNNLHEVDKLFAADIPGSFINGFKLAFYEQPAGSDSNLSPEELKNMIVDSLKLLKASIDELKESDAQIRESITQSSILQENLEKETIKLSLKLGMLENEIHQLKNAHKQLDSCKESISELKSSLQHSANEIGKLKQNDTTCYTPCTLHGVEPVVNSTTGSKGMINKRGIKLSRRSPQRRFILKQSE